MKNQDYIELCIKEITGNINSSENRKLKAWIEQSESNKNEYERLKTLWGDTSPDKIPGMPNVDFEWTALSEKLGLNEIEQKEESFLEKIQLSISSLLTTNLKPIGSLAVILLVAVIGLLLFNNESIKKYQSAEVRTPNAVTEEVLLPDGSVVILNSGSEIKYSIPFKEDVRLVELNGEAFFSVTKGDTPFVIRTGNANVKVLGTEFNVWSRSAKTKVTVKNGTVELASKSSEHEKVTLTRNEESIVVENNNPLEPRNVNSDYLLGWLDSRLVFNRTPLNEAAGEIERHFDIILSIQDEELKNISLTGSFKSEDPDSVLNMISLALDLNYSKEGMEYKITR